MKDLRTLARHMAPSELETLIADLADLRASMEPPISYEAPQPGENGPNLSVQAEPYMTMKRLRNGGVRMYLRNSGLGWLLFDFRPDQAIAIRDYLAVSTDADTASALFGEGGGTAH